MARALSRGALVTTAQPTVVGVGPVEQRVDAGDRRHAGGEAVAEHRLLAVEDGGVLAGEVAGEDRVVGVAHDVAAVFGQRQLAAALVEDRDEGGVVQLVGIDEGAVEVEEERRVRVMPAPGAGRADAAAV